MAIVTQQTTQKDSGANYVNSLTLGWPGNTTTGNFLAIIIATSNPSTTAVASVTDSAGNTWTKQASFAGTGNLSE